MIKLISKKIRHICIDCNKISSWRYPSEFTQTANNYRCRHCNNKIKNVSKIQKVRYICIDCGKISKLNYPSQFEQTSDNYRCKSCGIKLGSNTTQSKLNHSIASKRMWSDPHTRLNILKSRNTPECKNKMRIASIESQNRPDVKLKKSLASTQQWTNEDYRLKMKELRNSEEYKNRLKIINSDPLLKEKRRYISSEVASRINVKIAKSEAMKIKWRDPTHITKMSEIYNSKEHKLKLSESGKTAMNKESTRLLNIERNRGVWYGSVTYIDETLIDEIRHHPIIKNIRTLVFERDNYACQIMGVHGDINAHHYPKSLKEIINENHIISLNQALQCKDLLNPNNLITINKKLHNGVIHGSLGRKHPGLIAFNLFFKMPIYDTFQT